jgi:Fe2+ transport system protein FeoA
MNTTQLCCAEKGCIYEILSVKGVNRCRFAELGFNKGMLVTVSSHSENGPIKVNIRNYQIALRKEEAEDIIVRIVERK